MSELKEKISELLDILGRVDQMEAQELHEKSSEASFYNWLDDQVHEKDQFIFNLQNELALALKQRDEAVTELI